jgi:hypothetical protein
MPQCFTRDTRYYMVQQSTSLGLDSGTVEYKHGHKYPHRHHALTWRPLFTFSFTPRVLNQAINIQTSVLGTIDRHHSDHTGLIPYPHKMVLNCFGHLIPVSYVQGTLSGGFRSDNRCLYICMLKVEMLMLSLPGAYRYRRCRRPCAGVAEYQHRK